VASQTAELHRLRVEAEAEAPKLEDEMEHEEFTVEPPDWSVPDELIAGAGDGSSLLQTEESTVDVVIKIDGKVRASGILACMQTGETRGVVRDSHVVPFGALKGQRAWHMKLYRDRSSWAVRFFFWDACEVVELHINRQAAVRFDGHNVGSAEDPVELIGKSSLPPWPTDFSLFCCSRRNALRQGCRWLVGQSWFGNFVLLTILVSSICLALDTPRLDPDSTLKDVLHSLDRVFTAIFFTEMMLKVISFGFYFAKDAYIKNPWNQVRCATPRLASPRLASPHIASPHVPRGSSTS
jgi:hypothetical protein